MFGFDANKVGPLSIAAARSWMDALAARPFAWVIEHQKRFLGEIRLDQVELHNRRARLAIGLYDPDRLGQGLGGEAVDLVLSYAFTELELHRVSLRVVAYSERAIRCYRSCGFIEEGREREAAFVEGVWHDDIMMGILKSEFKGGSSKQIC